ncbi:hypothetical protein J6590_082136 [Homalodisca vitripennis]|nr:hypothetical protein J6590_082136 [Homalodisca vitripennis]
MWEGTTSAHYRASAWRQFSLGEFLERVKFSSKIGPYVGPFVGIRQGLLCSICQRTVVTLKMRPNAVSEPVRLKTNNQLGLKISLIPP